MTPVQPSLYDPPLEPTRGRTRSSDPQPSVAGAKRASVPDQRQRIAVAFICGREFVTADWLADNDNITFSHRSAWSARLGGLVRDGYMVKTGTVPGVRQRVTRYGLTPAGWVWARSLTSERSVA